MRYLPVLLLALLIGCTPDSPEERTPPEALRTLLDEVQQRHAPDRRVALLQLETRWEDGHWIVSGETNLPEAQAELQSALQQFGAQSEIRLLPDSTLEGQHHGIVRLSACNIRSEPRHSGELSTQALLGTPLKVYKKKDGWYLVQTPDGYLGWLDEGGFVPMDESAFEAWLDAPKAIFLSDFGFAYAKADENAEITTDLLAGNLLILEQRQGSFTKIQLPDGRPGFVPTEELLSYSEWLDKRQASADEILKSAKRFLGRPYLWGGTSGKGVDCSGFTKTVFFLHGMMLPRDASQQVAVGAAVPAEEDLSSLQPGDLLYFGRAASAGENEKVTHVALYMGDGKIIHATGNVKIESLRPEDPDFAKDRLMTFLRARRLLLPELIDSLAVENYKGYGVER